MSRWFRHYAGMMRDEKLVSVAVRSKQSVERVVWVWGAILESAAEADDGGRYDFDAAGAAYFLRADEADLAGILAALADAGRVAEGRVVKWGDRQWQSDSSAERQARYRERRRKPSQGSHADGLEVKSDGDVTSRDGRVTAQDTDTDTDTPPYGGDAGKPASEPDYRDQLWTEGTKSLVRQTGHTEKAAKSFIGKCLKAGKDDCRRVLTIIRQAEADRIVDPAAWIMASINAQAPPRERSLAEVLMEQARARS